jgi:uncharacterized phage infection (PIP) family protein YhgE
MANTSNDFLKQTLSQYHNDIAKLQSELAEVKASLSAITAGCQAKHRLNLTEEIAHLATKIKSNFEDIKKLDDNNVKTHDFLLDSINNSHTNVLNKVDDVNNALNNKLEEISKSLNELSGRVNILKIKYDSIETSFKTFCESKQKSKENRINFIVQILIIVLSSLFLGVLGLASTYIWQGFKQAITDNNQTQIKHTVEPNYIKKL